LEFVVAANQTAFGGHVVNNHLLQSPAQLELLAASAETFKEFNDRSVRSFIRHDLVGRCPDLTHIVFPITSSLVYVLCDLSAGPSALGRRFSDVINQLHVECDSGQAARKVGQGKRLKIIVIEPPQMQISDRFTHDSMLDNECFMYMNTESTVETMPCSDVRLSSSGSVGSGTDSNSAPPCLSMKDFFNLARRICSWNGQSQDHVCSILMDVVFGAQMTPLLLGMLSLVIGRHSEIESAQLWLNSIGDACVFALEAGNI
jgi:hypothetical protein